ncbi:MAG: hypothetical protein NC918_07795 [Candidatus Omnitrophica bacterium]|nr:hypothetical protein [Candidatus Omnitrophota bacterium]
MNINPIVVNKSSSSQNLYNVSKFLVNGKKVFDIAVPLLEGKGSKLHLGVSLESSKVDIVEFSKINYYLAITIFIGLGIGIFVFSILGIFLSNRIRKLKDFASQIGDGNLDVKIYCSPLRNRCKLGEKQVECYIT